MKSSSENLTDTLKNYFRVLYRPSEVVSDLSSKPVNLTETFIVVIISSILLVAGVFIVGDALYTVFQNYAFSYPLEILTSGQLFGFYLPLSSSLLVFIADIIFCLKAWIFLSVLFFIFLRIFKEQVSIKRVVQIIAWSLFPFAVIMFGAAVLCLIFKFIFPLVYHYIYFAIMAVVFLGIAPGMIQLFLGRVKDISGYNVLRSYYLTLFVVFVIWTINHADKILALVW